LVSGSGDASFSFGDNRSEVSLNLGTSGGDFVSGEASLSFCACPLASPAHLRQFHYHVMMMVFLASAIRAIKPVHVKVLITHLCYFFNTVSQMVIDRKELDDLKAYMIETMCMLEMCFPPPFFDMQQHLMIHLVDQILTLSPLYLHSMFPYERYLAVLKSYVRNRAHLEGSIMEGYTTEEVVECCADYVKDGKRIGLPISLHEGRLRGRGRMSQKSFIDRDYNSVSEAHFSVL
jgi:hypothetical protein